MLFKRTRFFLAHRDIVAHFATFRFSIFMVLCNSSITVKIASIEYRSNFIIRNEDQRGAYVGLEVGADISANLNLDDFMVFDFDEERSSDFFLRLVYNHLKSSKHFDERMDFPTTTGSLRTKVFTTLDALSEFVRASEGVPRDAIHIIGIAAQLAGEEKISINDIRKGAHKFYNDDKAAVISGNPRLGHLLKYLISSVIDGKRARAFLVPTDVEETSFLDLFDCRLIHLLKKNISSKHNPGERYDVFKIDYGCYVDLINTQKSTQGLFQDDEGQYLEVPPDDYRSIRTSILDLAEFNRMNAQQRVANRRR